MKQLADIRKYTFLLHITKTSDSEIKSTYTLLAGKILICMDKHHFFYSELNSHNEKYRSDHS